MRDAGASSGERSDDGTVQVADIDGRRERRIARAVTWGTLGVVLLGAAAEIEAWPVTSFRLFSTVRTADGATTSLVAIRPDSSQVTVRLPDDQVLATTSHQLVDLRHQSAHQQHAEAVAWLHVAGLDPDDYVAVAVDRSAWTMDPVTREREVHGTTRLVEVPL
ncbi:hypothetical protein CWIS_16660 [Cellulomonas sp. A375-1]|uniref:hypothetical protein n=1 Tax=Cellulomonas sp. A375-1 TaxID=1672219 RepID=UPI0006527E8D|nr:hypothetical protein [Cellulomonas sp. A375-1]KMM44344.1 hypothetical protein CWIS_16660 [Cellulomonas sp. A375-1]